MDFPGVDGYPVRRGGRPSTAQLVMVGAGGTGGVHVGNIENVHIARCEGTGTEPSPDYEYAGCVTSSGDTACGEGCSVSVSAGWGSTRYLVVIL